MGDKIDQIITSQIKLSEANIVMLDYSKYRGKGRPRKSDYSPVNYLLRKAGKESITALNRMIERSLLRY